MRKYRDPPPKKKLPLVIYAAHCPKVGQLLGAVPEATGKSSCLLFSEVHVTVQKFAGAIATFCFYFLFLNHTWMPPILNLN